MKLLSKEHRVQTKELINIILAGKKNICYVGSFNVESVN